MGVIHLYGLRVLWGWGSQEVGQKSTGASTSAGSVLSVPSTRPCNDRTCAPLQLRLDHNHHLVLQPCRGALHLPDSTGGVFSGAPHGVDQAGSLCASVFGGTTSKSLNVSKSDQVPLKSEMPEF